MTPQEIDALRQAMGLTQRQFAARIGVSAITVTNWRHGIKPAADRIEKIRALAREFETASPITPLPPGYAVVVPGFAQQEPALYVANTRISLNVAALNLFRGHSHLVAAVSPERHRMLLIPAATDDRSAFRVPKTGALTGESLRAAVLACGAVVGNHYPIAMIDGYATVEFASTATAP